MVGLLAACDPHRIATGANQPAAAVFSRRFAVPPIICWRAGSDSRNSRPSLVRDGADARRYWAGWNAGRASALGDVCKSIQGDLQGIQFACSPRLIHAEFKYAAAENNLPPKDPGLVEFVGRANYLLDLWAWLVDRHSPVKVLTALGGTGKTSIAYEFSRQIISTPPAWMSKLVWLTAKSQTFSAILGEYVRVTRTDFDTPDSFLKALAVELGATDNDLPSDSSRDDILDFLLDALESFPSLIVVDDVDSLSIQEQADLFSTVQVLAGRTFSKGTRFLLTSRLELGAGMDQRITVNGFAEQEFGEFARLTAQQLGLSLNSGVIFRLHNASLGSPLFCASILRLASLGEDINQAIKHWKGRAGDDVRKFAFQRELKELSDSQVRTLFALSALGDTTQLELSQVLNVDSGQLTADLAKLREYHLFAASGDPGTGAKLQTPEPIRLMANVMRERIADPARIERECARARRNVPKVQDKTSIAIASTLALWKADDYEAALLTAMQAQKANNKSGDLSCILGQCYLKITPQRAADADKSFRKAFDLGCQRRELAPNWFEARALMRDWAGVVELSKLFTPPRIVGSTAALLVDAMVQIALQQQGRGDIRRAAETRKEAMQSAYRVVADERGGDHYPLLREAVRANAREYVRLVSNLADRPASRLDVFNAAYDAFQCHVTESWLIEAGLAGLDAWMQDVRSRDRIDVDVIEIIENRSADLKRIQAQLREEGWARRDIETKVSDSLARLALFGRSVRSQLNAY